MIELLEKTEGSAVNKVLADVKLECVRQADEEGYLHMHDDDHDRAIAAACYAHPYVTYTMYENTTAISFRQCWPWPTQGSISVVKGGKDRRRQLVIAAALIVAEIERLDRESNYE